MLAGGLLALAGLLAAKPPAADVGVPGRTTPRPIYGVNWQGSLGLVRVDRDTLRPLAGRRIPLAREPLGWACSGPIATGAGFHRSRRQASPDRPAGMRSLGDVVVASRVGRRRPGQDRGACSPSSSLRAVAALATRSSPGSTPGAAAWSGGKRSGSLQAGERFRGGLLLVLGPRGRSVGPSRLVQVGPRGASARQRCPRSAPEPSRVVACPRAGTPDWQSTARAAAPSSSRRRRRWLRSISRRSRVRSGWGRALADAVVGPTRHALWLGRGLLAVTGSDSSPSTGDPEGDGAVGRRRPA